MIYRTILILSKWHNSHALPDESSTNLMFLFWQRMVAEALGKVITGKMRITVLVLNNPKGIFLLKIYPARKCLIQPPVARSCTAYQQGMCSTIPSGSFEKSLVSLHLTPASPSIGEMFFSFLLALICSGFSRSPQNYRNSFSRCAMLVQQTILNM